MQTIIHQIDPVFDRHARILILGTIPSPKSRESGFYYGHPQNRFWRVLAAVLNTPVPQTIPEKKAFLLRHRIALWDVLHSCDIEGAADSSIKNPVANDFSVIEQQAAIRQVFATGQTAAKLYRTLTGRPCACLPSTSPANCAVSFERLVDAYSAILPHMQSP